MKINRDMWRMDRAVEVIIVVWLVIAAILVASGVFRGDSEKRHKVHQWETMYEDNVLKVERCQCGQERWTSLR